MKLSKNYRYRKMHQIWSDKYIKRPKYQKLNFSKFLSTKCKKITPSCLVTLKRSTNSILIYNTDSYVINLCAILCLFDTDCRCFLLPFYAILSPFVAFYTFLCIFVAKSEICTFLGVKLSKKLSKADKSVFF